MNPAAKPALLCISQSFAPDTTPTAIRASKLLGRLATDWQVSVITEAHRPHGVEGVRVRSVRSRRPARLLGTLRRLHLDKLLELAVWPDDSIFWLFPAILAGRRLIREQKPDAIIVFMMPYSAGLAGIVLSRLARVPLVLNLDDSPTCADMHPSFPTRLHYRLAKDLEDAYARAADAVVYVSATNLETVRDRQPLRVREKLHLVRYGADPVDIVAQPPRDGRFEIAYVGAMSGWWALIGEDATLGLLKRAFRVWTRLGRYERYALDERTSSPAVIGRAIIDAAAADSELVGHVKLVIHGNPYPPEVVARALRQAGVQDVVDVGAPVPHKQVTRIIAAADLLFLTLPTRTDGSRGGRISAKTYEYLATDRPILAAVPPGENWDYLSGKPGVWLLAPDDEQGMSAVIAELARAKLAGGPLSFDRSELTEQLSYDTRAREFTDVVHAAIARRANRAG